MSGTLAQALTTPQGFMSGSLELDADYTAGVLSSINRPYASATSLKLYVEPDKGTITAYDTLGGGFPIPDDDVGKIGFEERGINQLDAARSVLYRLPEQGDQEYPNFALTYTSYGQYTADSARGAYDGQTLDTFFYFGIPTAIADLPRSGDATYSGIAAGKLYDFSGGEYTLDGTASLTANFASGSVETTMLLMAYAPGSTLDLGTFDGLAALDGGANSFRGTWVGSSTGYEGSILGSFFGPAAAEFGYSFGINKPDLTAIGGGVVIGGQNTSVPPPPPSPPPAPPPPAPPGSTFPLASAQTFNTFTAETGYSGSAIGGNLTVGGASSQPLSNKVTITVTPDYANGTYTVHDGSASLVFQLPALAPPPNPSNVTVTLNDAADDRLVLFNNLAPKTGTNYPPLQFHYLSFAFLNENDAVSDQHTTAALLFGTITPAADMPRSGTATYTTQGLASALVGYGGLASVQGQLTADFAAGTVQNDFAVGDYAGASLTPVYRISGSGSIAAGTPSFSGSLAGIGNSLTGSYNGGFFGPSATEVGFTFALSGTDNGKEQRIVGAAGGTR
jgi:hypothetical protein